MGTPDFSLPTLQALIDSSHEIVGIVTQPDKPKGRGQEVKPSPVKEVALGWGLKIFQPVKAREEIFIKEINRLQPDLIVVVAYGQILNGQVLNLPKLFCMNLHASLLPKYRGAAPINWAIINGEPHTGVTTMKMNEGLDTGDMLLKRTVTIDDSDNSLTLHNKLSVAGAQLVLETISNLIKGKLTLTPQNPDEATHAPKLQKNHGFIRWDQSTRNIHNLVRGLTPSPGAYTFFQGKRWIISKTETAVGNPIKAPGTIIRISDYGLEVSTGSSRLIITELKPEGKRCMPAKNFIQGHSIEVNDTFDTWPKKETNI